MISLIASLALASTIVQGSTTVRNDLHVTTFDLSQGKVAVYLPYDFMAGDRITGTVIATPTGTGDLLKSNKAVLEGVVVELEGAKPKSNGLNRSWLIPAGVAAVAIKLLGSDGTPKGAASIPTMPSNVGLNPSAFNCDPIMNVSGPMTIQGPFDGDSTNTSVACGPNPMAVLAETPRSCQVAGAPGTPGPTNITVAEAGATAKLPCNLIKMTMTSAKSTLLQGEKTSVNVQISGLEGLPKGVFPIPCEFTNETPTIVRMEQSTSNIFAIGLNQNQVKNGVGTMNIGLVGINPGRFVLLGVAFGTSIHDIKKLLNAPAFNAWLDAMIVKLEAEIKALEASGATDGGTKSKIARKKKTLSVLKGNRATAATLDDCKMAVDLALAQDSFFELAKELLVTAADLLGYTDIPVPAVGKIIKGLQAIAAGAKLVKTLAALAKAEALAEAYDKLTDVVDKVEKLAELKAAIESVQEALESERD